MPQTTDQPAAQTLLHDDSRESPGLRKILPTKWLSDGEAIIAVMVADGHTCQSVASKLFLPLRTIQGHLYQALEILGLSSVDDLTYEIVASHYNRSAPTVPASAVQLVMDTHRRVTADPANRHPGFPESAPSSQNSTHRGAWAVGTIQRRSSLAILDEAEAAQATSQELTLHSALSFELAATRALLGQEHETVKQLHQAVRSRDIIGQAKGILMERHKINADTAFKVLRKESSRSNRKLVDVADQLIYTGWEETH